MEAVAQETLDYIEERLADHDLTQADLEAFCEQYKAEFTRTTPDNVWTPDFVDIQTGLESRLLYHAWFGQVDYLENYCIHHLITRGVDCLQQEANQFGHNALFMAARPRAVPVMALHEPEKFKMLSRIEQFEAAVQPCSLNRKKQRRDAPKRIETVAFLLEIGFDPMARDRYNKTVLDYPLAHPKIRILIERAQQSRRFLPAVKKPSGLLL